LENLERQIQRFTNCCPFLEATALDSPSIRHLMRTFLENYDVGVCGEAADGTDVVLQAQELKPDLIAWTSQCHE
jgi:hypothetical protein